MKRAAFFTLWVLLVGGIAACGDPNATGSGGESTTSGTGGTGGATTTETTSSTITSTTSTKLTCSVNVASPPFTGGECDMLAQDCPPGQTCVPGPNAKTFCKKGGGLKGPGKPCNLVSGVEECQAGLFCIGAGGIGICTRPCCRTTDEPCEGGDCNGKVDFGDVVIDMCSYAVQCQLFAENSCPNGQQCQLVYPNQGLAVCTLPAPKSVPEGEPCEFVNECDTNLVCWVDTCRYNCLLVGGDGLPPGEGGCPAGQTCMLVYPPEAGDVGVCQ
ncbi:MAG: hypothetical protein IPK82_34735 [Polyangiaceae bacterium]|nr:hypothetical protein [Polyangiaceae bacterium]